MAQKPKAKRRGRPPMAPEKRKRPSMGFRPTAELREKLEQVAASSGLSMTQEVERRLERSFGEESATYEIFGGETNFRYMRLLGGIIHEVELITKALWTEDAHTKDKVIDLARAFFRRMGVEPLPDTRGGLFSVDGMMEHKAEDVLPEIIERWAAKFDWPNAPQKKKATHPKPGKKVREKSGA